MPFSGFIGLGTVNETGDFSELDMPGYGRQVFEFRPVINGRMQGAGGWLSWPAVANHPESYNAFAFYEDQEGGAPMLVYPEPTAHFMGSGEHASMNPYSVVIDLVDNSTGAGQKLDADAIKAVAFWDKNVKAGEADVSDEKSDEAQPTPSRKSRKAKAADETPAPPLESPPDNGEILMSEAPKF
jgi:hypothetical protein